jgi:hypothetical protein
MRTTSLMLHKLVLQEQLGNPTSKWFTTQPTTAALNQWFRLAQSNTKISVLCKPIANKMDSAIATQSTKLKYLFSLNGMKFNRDLTGICQCWTANSLLTMSLLKLMFYGMQMMRYLILFYKTILIRSHT